MIGSRDIEISHNQVADNRPGAPSVLSGGIWVGSWTDGTHSVNVTVNGDKGTLYFQCVYVDMKTGKVKSVVAADQNVQKIDGKWLITSSAASPSTLGA